MSANRTVGASVAPLSLAVTGASGFIGSAVVRAALAQGHEVRAILRHGSRGLALEHPLLQVHAVGLAHTPGLVQALRGADAVLHIAAGTQGDYARRHADTVTATSQLIAAMREAGVGRLVGISSFAVYDYAALADHALLDEGSPLVSLQTRSAYARVKREQESLFAAAGATVLRPGVVYDRDRLWQFVLGRALGRRAWLLLGPDSAVPLVHVDDVAQAVLLAARGQAAGTAINLVEDAPPRRRQLLRYLNALDARPRLILRLPWGLHRAMAALVQRIAGPRKTLPGLLDPMELDLRFKPLRYDNHLARERLGWQPQHRAIAG